MRYRRIALASVASLTFAALSASAQEPQPEPCPPPRWDYIEFKSKGWGELISSWRLTSRGGGSWTRTRRAEHDPSGPHVLVWHGIEDDPALFAELVSVLAQLPGEAPDFNSCENFMPDLAYGTIRLTKGATTTEIAWNSGCMDPDYRAFIDTLQKADRLVAQAGREGAVLREERAPQG